MADGRRGNQDGRPRRELDDQLEVPQDEVPAKLGVEIPEGGDSAEAVRQIICVCVRETARTGSEINRGAGKDAARRNALEAGVARVELPEGVAVVSMQARAPIFKHACSHSSVYGARV